MAVFFAVIAGFLLVMSVLYSFMLRDSISSALEMMSLKKGIVTGETAVDVDGGDRPTPDQPMEDSSYERTKFDDDGSSTPA